MLHLVFLLFSISRTILVANDMAAIMEPGTEEVLVTATRTFSHRQIAGDSGRIFTRKDIEAAGKTSLVEVLKSIPGIFVKQQGGTGSVTSISLRGVPYKFTLALIDGMKLVDYMGNGGSGFPVLDHLKADEIERVEIVYGPQSTLWGSDAVGGVIQIFTRKGQGKKSVWLEQEIGSHGSSKTLIGLQGSSNREDYSISVSRHDLDGFSEAIRANPNLFAGDKEDDGYANFSTRLNLGFEHKSGAETRVRVHSIKSKKEIDGFFDGDGPADQNSRSETSDLYMRFEHSRRAEDGTREERFSFSSTKFNSLNFIDSVSAFGPFAQNTRFVGSVRELNWQRDFYLNNQVFSLGWEFEQDYGSSTDDHNLHSDVVSYYLQNQWLHGNFSITLGARRDQHSSFGSHNTWKIAPSYRKGKNRFFGSFGTGFKAPTIFELHSQQRFFNNLGQLVLISNPELQPASSRGYSFGFIRDLDGQTNVGFSYYQNDIENTVDFLFAPFPEVIPFGFFNLGEVKTRGFEISLDHQLTSKLNLRTNYSRVNAREFPRGLQLRRQPKHQFKNILQYELNSRAILTLDYSQYGDQIERYASDLAPAQYNQSYRVLDLSYAKKISGSRQLNLRVENLLDSDFQEIFGYANGGRKFYLVYKHSF